VNPDIRFPFRRIPEPSAVDRLAALVDPEGEAAERVQAWKEARAKLRIEIDGFLAEGLLKAWT
jgi:hypothetical protein